jgi:hypothetical protein
VEKRAVVQLDLMRCPGDGKTPFPNIARRILENNGLGYTRNMRNALSQAIEKAEKKLRAKGIPAG